MIIHFKVYAPTVAWQHDFSSPMVEMYTNLTGSMAFTAKLKQTGAINDQTRWVYSIKVEIDFDLHIISYLIH